MTGTGGQYRRRSRGRAAIVVVLLLAGGAWIALNSGSLTSAPTAETVPSDATPTESATTLDEILDEAVTNPDGSVSVTLDEAETGVVVAAALERAPTRSLRDVEVDLVPPEDDADGRMIVSGRLASPPVPVRATIDVDVVDRSVRPTVRDLRVGPVPVSDDIRDDVTAQLQMLSIIADDRLVVRRLRTDDGTLEMTGRPR